MTSRVSFTTFYPKRNPISGDNLKRNIGQSEFRNSISSVIKSLQTSSLRIDSLPSTEDEYFVNSKWFGMLDIWFQDHHAKKENTSSANQEQDQSTWLICKMYPPHDIHAWISLDSHSITVLKSTFVRGNGSQSGSEHTWLARNGKWHIPNGDLHKAWHIKSPDS